MAEHTHGHAGSAPALPPGTSGTKMIVTLGSIGLVCGVLIVGAFQVTLSAITRNKATLLQESILAVVPNATHSRTFVEHDGVLSPDADAAAPGERYYAAYDAGGTLMGVAVEAQGQGFADAVKLIYGYSPQRHAIVGFKVLESHETPGLGTKIESDPGFRANFDSLQVVPTADFSGVEHSVELAKHGKKEHPWQVEAITGATISSRAVARMLKTSTDAAVPIIAKNLEVLKGGAQ
ncbi:MAG TPA: FMN-binding protein [Candidatus Krumholzibacteria bacterium]|nr:FMN-binding protein [Candidatus Krumholzibacteria bacterium]